nr:MAG TPA: hypothetical protein [Caudoviricetes sp.]
MDKNGADFTQKELCLLLETICEKELGVYVAKDVKNLRSKTDVFANDDTIQIQRVQNKQGTTRVSIFVTNYCDDNGMVARGYTPTI